MRYFVLLLHCLGVFVGSSLVRLVPITVGFSTLGGKGVVKASPPGLVNRLRRIFLNELPVLFGCPSGSAAAPFGTVLVGLRVRFPFGVFLLMVMFRVLLLSLLVLRRCRGVNMLVVLSCLAWWVVLECSAVGEFLGPLKRVRLHSKTPAHLAGCGRDGSFQSRPKFWKRSRISEGPRFRHIGAKIPRLHQGDGAHDPLDRVGVG